MANNSSGMKRREFFIKSALFFAGGFAGLNPFSRTLSHAYLFRNPRIALIIDDIGFSNTRLNNFLEIGAPLTFSILPRLDRSLASAREIHSAGHEIMLHQPMEPFDPVIDPGPGAIYVGDSPERIAEVIARNISDTPFVKGINNHMGSKFTSYGKEMEEALMAIKEKDLFFIDSLTTNRSKGYGTAKRLNISAARRNIFLDVRQDVSSVLEQLGELKRIAIENGFAIGIGHPFPETAEAVKLFHRDIRHSGISLVHASNLMRS